jgi:6,7-dimethyl-8-ribityllumazine synthase
VRPHALFADERNEILSALSVTAALVRPSRPCYDHADMIGGSRKRLPYEIMSVERSTAMAGPRRGKRAKGEAKGARILLVEARFYDDIADALLAGAMKVLDEAQAKVDRISVPGSLEIPAAIAMALDAAQRKRRPYDGAVALGCVIRGDTIHFDIVSHQSARGLMDIAIARALPLGNGIITVDTEAQALARARPEEQDKGGDAARAALALVDIKRRLAGAMR